MIPHFPNLSRHAKKSIDNKILSGRLFSKKDIEAGYYSSTAGKYINRLLELGLIKEVEHRPETTNSGHGKTVTYYKIND